MPNLLCVWRREPAHTILGFYSFTHVRFFLKQAKTADERRPFGFQLRLAYESDQRLPDVRRALKLSGDAVLQASPDKWSSGLQMLSTGQ